jgi:hypothetical protein
MTSMNPNRPDPLTLAIDRELKSLPELPAPAALRGNVMAELNRRAQAPGLQRSWQNWSPSLRAATLAGLVTVFAAICFGVWRLWEMAPLATQTPVVAGWISGANTCWQIVGTLSSAVTVIFQELGTGFIIGIVLVGAVSYAACAGLGTMVIRHALAPRR